MDEYITPEWLEKNDRKIQAIVDKMNHDYPDWEQMGHRFIEGRNPNYKRQS